MNRMSRNARAIGKRIPAATRAAAGAAASVSAGVAATTPVADDAAHLTTSAGDDHDLFRDAVRDVAPLSNDVQPLPDNGAKALTPGQLARREAAVAQGRVADPNYLDMRDIRQLSPHEIVDQHKDGVQHGVLKKLRQGEYPIQDALDLHRKTVLQARHELYWFLQRSLAKGLRLVLITHGKGIGAETEARLKSHVAYWVTLVPEIVACHSAMPRHGGTGALYVLLRKSEADRVENRERHGRKGQLDHTR